jgi:hypothetical protein
VERRDVFRAALSFGADETEERPMNTTTPVDHPDRETVKVRQGTGPRAMVSVLLISMAAAAVIGVVLLAYFFAG